MQELSILKEILEKVGFPIFIAFFLLLRTDTKLDKITDLQRDLLDLLKNKKE